MLKKCLIFVLFVNFIVPCASYAMLSLKQTCHNTLNNSLLSECINVICAHNLDDKDLPEDLKNEIQKRKGQLNLLLASALNGQKCMVNYYKKHIYSLSCVPELVQSGAHLSTVNQKGQSALHVAAMTNKVSLVQFLVEHCASEDLQSFIHEQDGDGNTPLHCAAENNACESMNILIKIGADLSAQDNYARTPLHKAAESNAVESIALLLHHGINIDALDEECNTALHLAARLDNVQTVEYLLTHGAQPTIQNKDKKTPLDCAYELGVSKSALLLKNLNKNK